MRICLWMTLALFLAIPFSFAQEKSQKIFDGVSMDFQEADLKDILKIFSQQSGLNFVADEKISNRKMTLYLDQVSVEDALYNIMMANQLIYEKIEGSNVFMVKEAPPPPEKTVPTITKIYTLKYARLADETSSSGDGAENASSGADSGEQQSSNSLISVLESLLSEHGKLAWDKRTNSLIMTDINEKFQLFEKIIGELDVAVPQVAIEAEIIETVSTTLDRIGVEYGGTTGQMGTLTGAKRDSKFPFPHRLAGASESSFTVGTLDASALKLALELLSKDSQTKFLARPKVITLNNQQAEIKITADTAVATVATLTSSEGTSQSTTEPERMETGITLKVTPQINRQDRLVTMLVEPEVTRPEDSKFFSGTFVDPLHRKVKTTVMLKDNETLVMGGLIESQTADSMRKVPVLGNIPLAGLLFSKKISDTTERELLIFVTPYVIAPGESRSAFVLPPAMSAEGKQDKIKEDLEAMELIQSIRE